MITAKEAEELTKKAKELEAAVYLDRTVETIYTSIRKIATSGKNELYINADVSLTAHSEAVIDKLMKQGFFAKLQPSLEGYDYLYITWGK